MCMFKHEESEDESDQDEEADDDDADEEENVTKLKPMLEKVKKAVENFDVLLNKFSLKCEYCEFEARNRNGLNMHVKAKHTNINNS